MLVALFFFTPSPFSQRQQWKTTVAPSPVASLPKLPKLQRWDWNLLADFYRWLDKLPESAVTYGYWLPSNIPNMIQNVYADSGSYGVTSTGSTSYPTTANQIQTSTQYANTGANELWATQWSAGSAGTVTEVGANLYQALSVSNNAVIGIYSDNSNYPGSLLAQTAQLTSGASGWTYFNLANSVYVANGSKYWVVFLGNFPYEIYYTSNACSGNCNQQSYSYSSTMPSTYPSGAGWGNSFDLAEVHVNVEGYTEGTRAQFTGTTGALSSFSFYTSTCNGGDKFVLALYSDSSGNPGSEYWNSSTSGTTCTANSWNTVNESSGTVDNSWNDTLTNGSYYWLMWQWNSADPGPNYVSGGASNSGIYLAQSFGNLSSTWSGGTLTTWNWSEYATGSFSGPPPSDFTISATTPSQTVGAGSTATYTLTITYSPTLTATVNLVVTSGCPASVTCTFTPNNMVTASGTVTLNVPTLITTPSATTTVTITASSTSPSLSHQVTVQLTVTGPGTYAANVHAGATQVVVTVTWTGTGTSSVTLAGPAATPTLSESGQAVYDRSTSRAVPPHQQSSIASRSISPLIPPAPRRLGRSTFHHPLRTR